MNSFFLVVRRNIVIKLKSMYLRVQRGESTDISIKERLFLCRRYLVCADTIDEMHAVILGYSELESLAQLIIL